MITNWTPQNSRSEAGANICIVSVGRNVGSEPMDDENWAGFQSDVWVTLSLTVGRPKFVVVGEGGEWAGITEESAVFTVLNPDVAEADRLYTELSVLADAYFQDAIAVTFGTSKLVG